MTGVPSDSDLPPGTVTTGQHAVLKLKAETRRHRTRWRRRVVRGLGVGVILLLAYMSLTFIQVWRASSQTDEASAEAIVVLGAAQYDGRPSPVLEDRLERGLGLYREGTAPFLVVTGGRQDGDTFTEATSGYNWLRERGVPDEAILKEVQGRTTFESLAAAFRFLEPMGITKVVLVTDGYHAYRAGAIGREVGFETSISAVPGSDTTIRSLARETVAVSAGRLIGYRRLTNLMH